MGMLTAVSLLGTPPAAAKPMAAEVLAEGQTSAVLNAKGENTYPGEWYRNRLAFRKQWQQVVARHVPKLAMHNWIRNMSGVETNLENVTLRGKPYVRFWICQPHNCPGNTVYVLIDILSDKQDLYAYHVYEVTDPKQAGYKVLRTETRMYGEPIDFELEHLKEMHREQQP